MLITLHTVNDGVDDIAYPGEATQYQTDCESGEGDFAYTDVWIAFDEDGILIDYFPGDISPSEILHASGDEFQPGIVTLIKGARVELCNGDFHLVRESSREILYKIQHCCGSISSTSN